MIKQGKNNYSIVSGRNKTSQYLFAVKTEPQIFCNKPVQVYPTNYDSLYVVIDLGGFHLASGKRMGFSGGTQHLQYYQPSVSTDGRLFVQKTESTRTDDPNSGTPHYLNLDYELHQGTKLDYLFFENSKMLEGSQIKLLKESMRTRKNPNIDCADAFNGKPTSSWIYAHWEPLYVPQYRSQPRMAISLPPDAFSATCDEPMLR